MGEHTTENDAAYTREDMERAFNEGVLAMSRALQGGSEPQNPYCPIPPLSEREAQR